MTVVDKLLVDHLGANVAGLTKGANLFRGPLRSIQDVPRNSVFVPASGGPRPDRVMGRQTEIRYATITIRGRNSSYDAGHSVMLSILDELKAANITGLLDIRTLQSEPSYQGEDPEGNHTFALTVEAVYCG